MKTFTYVIKDEHGMHARPAGELVKLVKTLASKVTIVKDGKSANAKSTLAIMSLGAKQDSEVTFNIEGEDEEAAAAALEKFMTENL
ncbi:MAG: HPr family phosphocarrier protein [Eubacterium sp.]|nr:HPr family phosphocarrier protein [Eubacterium sp.]